MIAEPPTERPAFPEVVERWGALIRARDWSTSPLGPAEAWPASLRVGLSLMLNSPESMFLAWGPQLRFFFHDTYRPIPGPRLDGAMGQPLAVLWSDVWEQVKPIVDKALAGEASRYDDLPLTMARHGTEEET